MARKLIPPSLKKQRGTYRPRDKMTFEIITPKSLPQQPDILLTKLGAQIWLDIIGRATQAGASELDSYTLGLLCNLLADLSACWATGSSPPISAIGAAHRLSESLGMSGTKSRVAKGIDLNRPAQPNPFAKFLKDPPPPAAKPPRK
jgi:hypothetical protein